MNKLYKVILMASFSLIISNQSFADTNNTTENNSSSSVNSIVNSNRAGLDKILDSIAEQQDNNVDKESKVATAQEEQKVILSKGESIGKATVVAITPQVAAQIKLLAQNSTGFMTGKITQGHSPIMVFFDPQCPFCKSLWNASRAGENQNIPVIWIPVSILNDNSYGQSAAILSSEHPIDIMNKHIAILNNGGKGIEPMPNNQIPESLKIALDRNILLYSKLGFKDFPIIFKMTSKGSLLIKKGDASIKGLQLINNM